ERATRGEVTVSDEATASDEELALPEWLNTSEDAPNVRKFGNDASGPGYQHGFSQLPALELELEADALEHQNLLDSLSPGARAIYLGGIQERLDALDKERERRAVELEREAAQAEREEAAYRAFIEARLRRLRGERASEK
ncbi:MAG: hypothetical protein WBN29_02235, partial [Polyangiales bacterium]